MSESSFNLDRGIQQVDAGTSKQELNKISAETASIKEYLSKLTSEQQKICKEILKQFRKVNVGSFFFNKHNTNEPYVAKGKKLDGGEEKAKAYLDAQWANTDEQVKRFFQLVEGTRGANDFVTKKSKDKVGQFGALLDAQRQTEAIAVDQLKNLLADTDMDNQIEALDQRVTTTKRERKQLEKAQKEQGKGTVSEDSISTMFEQALRTIQSKTTVENQNTGDVLAKNLASYLGQTPKDINTFVAYLKDNPGKLGQLRTYARMAPDDFLKIATGGKEYVKQTAISQIESTKQIDEDKIKVKERLNSDQGVEATKKMIDELHEKFRGVAVTLETEKDKIKTQLEQANTGVIQLSDDERLRLVQQYTALQDGQSTLNDPNTARKIGFDLISTSGVVSLTKGTEGVGVATAFRLYEQQVKSLLQTVDLQVGGFQGVNGPKSTALGLNIVFGGILAQSRKNTLFYSIYGGVGAILINGITGFGWNAGAVIGDEFRVNSKKLKKLDSKSKVMLGALAGVSAFGGITNKKIGIELNAQAGVYARRDKLAGLNEQQSEIYVTILEILKRTTDTSVSGLTKVINEYCKEQNIKQTAEEVYRVAYVLHGLLIPYGSLLGQKTSTQPDWMVNIAEQVARNRYNTAVDEAKGFAVTSIGYGASMGISASSKGLKLPGFLGIGMQFRKKSVYTPDQDSQVREGQTFEQASYGEKFTGSFADNIDRINTQFGLPPKEASNKESSEAISEVKLKHTTRPIGDNPTYSFVQIPEEILKSTNPLVEVWIAPLLIEGKGDAGKFNFQKNEHGYELPGTMPVRLVDQVKNGRVVHKIVIGDIMGKDAVRLVGTETQERFATDDKWITAYEKQADKILLEQKKDLIKTQLFSFFEGKSDWNTPFDLKGKNDVDVIADVETGFITGYRFKLKPGITEASFYGGLPNGVKIENGGLVFPDKKQLDIVYSTKDKKYLLSLKDVNQITFGYKEEKEGFESIVSDDVNVDLLTEVSPELDAFISSRAGAEMLMAWRYDIRSTAPHSKENYYKLMQAALKSGDYTKVYNAANTVIQTYGNDKVRTVFTNMKEGGVTTADRANLYLLYGALSRVRMTEYKQFAGNDEKLATFDALITGTKLSPDETTYLRGILTNPATYNQANVEGILKKLTNKFTGWGDTKYYYTTFKRTDPLYRLIFMFAPVGKIFETRTTATAKRLDKEFAGDAQKKTAIMNAYAAVQDNLNTGRTKEIFADTGDASVLKKDIGLVFGYGPEQIDEKFVVFPKKTGEKIALPESDKAHIQDYYLDRFLESNPHDAQQEVKSMIEGVTNYFAKVKNIEGVTNDQKIQYIKQLNDTLLPKGNIDKTVYKELMKTGKITGLDRFNTNVDCKVDWGMTSYSECINFMITKSKPELRMKFKQTYEVTGVTPGVIDFEGLDAPGAVVFQTGVTQNQSDRRTVDISIGVVAEQKPSEVGGESETLPVDISEEDYNKINLEGTTPSSITVEGTGQQVNAFKGKFGTTEGMFYIDGATGNRKFREGVVIEGPNSTLLFAPKVGGGNINVADMLFTGPALASVSTAQVMQLMQQRIKKIPYDAYSKQQIDFSKKNVDAINSRRAKTPDKPNQ